MRDFFENLGKGFSQYWGEMKTADGIYWLWLPGALVVVWLLSFLLRFIMGKSKYPFKTVYNIHSRIAVASAITGFAMVVLMIYWWANKYYDTHPLRFIHLLTMILLLLVPLISLLILRSYYKKEALREISDNPKTELQKTKFIFLSRKGFTRLKWWGALLALGAIIAFLIWGLKKDRNMVSIVIDNSTSMEEALKNGKTALGNTFKNLDNNTDIIITSFNPDSTKVKNTYQEILQIKKYGLASITSFFENPSDALAYINNLSVDGGSPIVQNIWENYQFVKQTRDLKQYQNICLLIITDGMDNINASIESVNQFLCQNQEFNEVFPAENIRIIDVLGNYENGNTITYPELNITMKIALFDKAAKCGYDIQNGKTLDDYTLAVQDALKEFQKDWRLLYWMGVFYLLYLLSLIFINPGNKL